MRSTFGRSVLVSGMALAAAISVSAAMWVTPAQADPGGVVISELNYHAGSDLDADDFLELTNTSATPIDLSGWSLTAGVTASLPAGTSLAPGARYVVAKDATQFQTTYGSMPDAVYSGNLSNSGETVTLADSALQTVDTVSYLDAAPWPATPDGTGPSLELRDLMADNTLPESWGASTVTGGTPGRVNSIDGTGSAPVITDLAANPGRPTASQPIVVSAHLKPGSTATLTYKVMFGPDVPVPFLDDAASPGGAGDGVYAATIPAQAAGRLVRYRVDATYGSTSYSAPSADDSVRYRGVVVTNTAVNSQLPVIEWFMDPAVYDDLLANHRLDDVQGDAVWSYNGQVYDGVKMSIRGNSSRTDAKVNWKVELPKGYEFDLGGQLPYPLDEFALQNYKDNFADVGWATVRAAGARSLNIVPVRTQLNGAFWSLGRIMETEDGSWRDAQGVDDWAIYKGDAGSVGRSASPTTLADSGWLEKKTRKDEDFTDVWTLSNTVDQAASAAQQAWIYQNVNIPELVNYMAINSIIRHQDSGYYNWWLARDTEGTGRWEMWHWDLNWIFTTPSSDGKGLFLTPDTSNRFTRAMLNYPEIREMFYRRLRTLADQFLPAGKYEAQWDAISARTTPDWNLDRTKWGGYTPASARTSFLNGLADRRNAIANNTGPGKLVPSSQSPSASVVINELQYHPSGNGVEYVELANPGSTAVDISGWTIDAVGLTIQPGTVIPAGGRMVFVSDDAAFRQQYPSGLRTVGGEFPGTLDDTGEAVVLRDGSRAVDTVTYSNAAPWPTAADGTGPSLELSSTGADNSVAGSWTATSSTAGTPGLANTTSVNLPPTASFTPTVNGSTVSVNAASSSDDGTISTYAWNFGDQATGTGVTTSHTYAAAGTYTVTLTVTDNTGRTGTTTRQVTVQGTPPATSTVVPAGSAWRWRYSAGAPPTNWKTVGFDASTWNLGNAVLGFGSTVATNINTFSQTASRPITAYFTKTFQVPDAAKVTQLNLRTRADDGVVIYVNGTEVTRSNMPSGTIGTNTYATSARTTTTAAASPVTVNVPLGLLVNGTNVVSAETHLNYHATPNVTFDLVGTMTAAP
jgi:PKD repeat protein